MICESVNSDQEEKQGDLLNGDRIINLKNFITNIDKFLLCKEFLQERELQIKVEEQIDVENFIDCVEDYFWLTPSYKQKGVRLVPAQDGLFALILWYVAKSILRSQEQDQFALKTSNLYFYQIDLIVRVFIVR